MKLSSSGAVSTAPAKLGRGTYQGFSKLPSQIGVYLCLLRPVIKKRDPNHSDYYGVIALTGSKAHIHVWVQHIADSEAFTLLRAWCPDSDSQTQKFFYSNHISFILLTDQGLEFPFRCFIVYV
jgi:hypothetical protein